MDCIDLESSENQDLIDNKTGDRKGVEMTGVRFTDKKAVTISNRKQHTSQKKHNHNHGKQFQRVNEFQRETL